MKKHISEELIGEKVPVVLTYGGGTNSTAIIVELIKRNYHAPDLIIFADTGAEKPYTYDHIKLMNSYLAKNGFPEITTVRSEQESKSGGIYEMSLRNKRLPAVAYGYKSCSVQFKIEPVKKKIAELFGRHNKYINIVGYDFDEVNRANNSKGKEDENQINWFPLINWEMGRDDCIESIVMAGLQKPGKSSCFICPNMRKHEIIEMSLTNPELMNKALHLEEVAFEESVNSGNINPVIGLGRTWKWKNLLATDDMFGFCDTRRDDPCGCYDGD